MLPQTIKLVRGVLETDETLTAKQRDAILNVCRDENGTDYPVRPPDPDRILRRGEVAKLLGRSTRAVDLLARQNLIKKIRLPGRARAAGFKLSAVTQFLENAE